jgi:hypothetical protein
MRNQYVHLVEKLLKENPSEILVKGEYSDLDAHDSITFGFFNGILYSASRKDNQQIRVDGALIGKEELTNIKNFLIEVVRKYNGETTLESAMDIDNIPGSEFRYSYHSDLAFFARFYGVYSDLLAFKTENKNASIKATMDKLIELHLKYDSDFKIDRFDGTYMADRDGLSPAGRIFPSAKAISFYTPKKVRSSNKVVDVIFDRLKIPNKEAYVIEYQNSPSKYVQRPYQKSQEQSFKQDKQTDSSDEEIAKKLLAKKAADERAKNSPKNNTTGKIPSKYHSYGPNKGD